MAAGVRSLLACWLGGAGTVPSSTYTVVLVANETLTDAGVTAEDLD